MKREEGSFEETELTENTIKIGNESFQAIFGFGGAFTDAAAINILSLSRGSQEKLLR